MFTASADGDGILQVYVLPSTLKSLFTAIFTSEDIYTFLCRAQQHQQAEALQCPV